MPLVSVPRVVSAQPQRHVLHFSAHTHVYIYVFTFSYCPTADVFYSRVGNAAVGTQWSGGLDCATGQGGTSTYLPSKTLTDKHPDEITH